MIESYDELHRLLFSWDLGQDTFFLEGPRCHGRLTTALCYPQHADRRLAPCRLAFEGGYFYHEGHPGQPEEPQQCFTSARQLFNYLQECARSREAAWRLIG